MNGQRRILAESWVSTVLQIFIILSVSALLGCNSHQGGGSSGTGGKSIVRFFGSVTEGDGSVSDEIFTVTVENAQQRRSVETQNGTYSIELETDLEIPVVMFSIETFDGSNSEFFVRDDQNLAEDFATSREVETDFIFDGENFAIDFEGKQDPGNNQDESGDPLVDQSSDSGKKVKSGKKPKTGNPSEQGPDASDDDSKETPDAPESSQMTFDGNVDTDFDSEGWDPEANGMTVSVTIGGITYETKVDRRGKFRLVVDDVAPIDTVTFVFKINGISISSVSKPVLRGEKAREAGVFGGRHSFDFFIDNRGGIRGVLGEDGNSDSSGDRGGDRIESKETSGSKKRPKQGGVVAG